MEDRKELKIEIAGRKFLMPGKDVESCDRIHLAAYSLDSTYKLMRKQFPDKDEFDTLAVTALSVAVRLAETGGDLNLLVAPE